MIRGTVERHARAQLVPGLWAPAQLAQAPPMMAPHTPQMALPLRQPPRSRKATPYQQAVQLTGKSTGRGVTFDSTADKAAPTGGQSTEDHGRQRTRGWGDGGRSVSHPRGVQEKTNRQMPCLEGELPSGATQNVPQTTASEGTPPQWGGHAKTLPHNPAQLAAKYRITGWRKDLKYVFKVYYKHNFPSYKEGEWVKMKDKFFPHFLLHKEEVLDIKERCPMDFMPYIEDQFWRATGLRLHGLRDFMAWIKQGSYYHGLVAQQGHLHRCPHLARAPLPKCPQVTPSESNWNSQKRAETPATGSSEPSIGATMAPVKETAVTHPDDTPAPMETGGAGDGYHGPNRLILA